MPSPLPQLGAILTSAASMASLRPLVQGLSVLKVVPAWGLPWTPALRHEAARLCPSLVVRTVAGDPSYKDEQGRPRSPLIDANEAEAEVDPWWAARDPARPFFIELGNEPVIGPPNGASLLSEDALWEYADLLRQTIYRVAARYPGARIILPAQMLNHPVRVGGHSDGAAWHMEVMAGKLSGLPPSIRARLIVGIHAYTEAQYTKGRALAARLFPDLPVWLTEFALNEPLAPGPRGQRYGALLRRWDVGAALLYHVAQLPGADPTHFNENYRLSRATLDALLAPEPPPMTNDTIILRATQHTSPRGDVEILAAVVHATVGTNSLGWLTQNPEGVSCHALITKRGQIIRMAPDHLATHHVGFSQIRLRQRTYAKTTRPTNNQVTLGVELENLNNGRDPYPEPQVAALGWLLADWLQRHPDIALLKHRDIDTAGKTDPHSLTWVRIHEAMAPWLAPPRTGRYRLREATPVYERPDVYAPVAWKGEARLERGRVEELRPLAEGPRTWLHWAPGGFVPRLAVEAL